MKLVLPGNKAIFPELFMISFKMRIFQTTIVNNSGTGVQWLLALTGWIESWFPGVFLCGVCMFSPCVRGISLWLPPTVQDIQIGSRLIRN